MIEIQEKGGKLLLYYTPERPPYEWVRKELDKHGSVVIARTFHFTADDLVSKGLKKKADDDFDVEAETSVFTLAAYAKGYYRIKARILDTRADVLLSKQLPISHKTFIAHRGISIFAKIDELVTEPIVIG